jgi:hypothetical protein
VAQRSIRKGQSHYLFGEYKIWTSHPVRDVSGHQYRPTTFARDIASDGYGRDNRAIWQWLGELHRVMAEADRVVGGVDRGR